MDTDFLLPLTMESPPFVWTAEKESLLIDLVRHQPALWNPADENYTKKRIKKQLFTLIGQEMGKQWPQDASAFNTSFIHIKFNSLKSYFNKEEKRRLAAESDGFYFVPKWIHYDKLGFLRSVAGLSETTMDMASEDAQPKNAIFQGQPDLFENSQSLEGPCIIKEEPSTSDIESNPSLQINSEPSRTETQGEEILSSLQNIEGSSSSDEERTPSMLISRKPPRKRIRKNPADEMISLATSALKNIENRQDSNSSSVPYAIGNLVQTTLRNLSPERSCEFAGELFVLISKYTQYINCSR